MERRRALIVEDDSDIRELLAEILEGEGFEVGTAEDGLEALEELAKARPDLITLDLNMPRMSGWQVLETLWAEPELSTIPVIVVAAHGPSQSRIPLQRVAGYHVKPFHIDAFVQTVREATAAACEHAPAAGLLAPPPAWRAAARRERTG